MDQNLKWYQGISKYQWMVLAVASVGWVFDVFEGQLFAIYQTEAVRATIDTSKIAPDKLDDQIDMYVQYAMAAFLVGGAVGGLLFGVLADRIGRRKTMVISILFYSVFTGLHYFATDLWHIVALRFLVAVGVGGEWAIAAALVAEVFPKRSRAAASGIFHASSVLGVVIAVCTRLALADMAANETIVPENAWRVAFLVGFFPALLVLWVRASVHESERWEKATGASAVEQIGEVSNQTDGLEHKSIKPGSVTELLSSPDLRQRALIGLGLASIGMASYWAIIPWAMEYTRSLADESQGEIGTIAYLIMNLVGALPGLLLFAPAASRFGRRKAFIVYHIGAFIAVPAAFLLPESVPVGMTMLSVMAFFVVGMHAGYAIYFPELFPTHLRATGSSFCFNVGRLVSAVLLIVRGDLRASLGLTNAVSAMSVLFLIGIVLLAFAPETQHRDLDD